MAFCALVTVSEQSYARDLTDAEKQVIADTVREELRDPASAMFKWGPSSEKAERIGSPTETIPYCAMVNARNGFGGFSGDMPFHVVTVLDKGEITQSFIIGLGSAEFKGAITYEMCEEIGYGNAYFVNVQ